MYNLEVLQDRLTEFLVSQSDGADLYVGPRENLTDDHILVDGHVNMADLAQDVQKLFEEMSKTQIINSPEEADNLPEGVLMLTEQGGYWESHRNPWRMGLWWREPGDRSEGWKVNITSEDLTYPATVIHRS